MAQRFLPVYFTGWFYLLLAFWAFSLIYINADGLKKISQVNINSLYDYINIGIQTPNQELTVLNTLMLESSFNEKDLNLMQALLTEQPQSKIVLLGEPSADYLSALSLYLMGKPRKNKIIIASEQLSSGQEMNTINGIFSNLTSPLRYPSRRLVKRSSNKHFIFTPHLMTSTQDTELLWQHQQHIYLSLLGEALQQLAIPEMVLTESWQLNLSAKVHTENLAKPVNNLSSASINHNLNKSADNTSRYQLNETSSKLADFSSIKMGFSSRIFTAEYEPIPNIEPSISIPVNTMSQYMALIKEQGKAPTKAYDLIVLSNKQPNDSQALVSAIKQVIASKNLNQNITTLLLFGLFSMIGLLLIWFIAVFSYKKQMLIMLVYYLALLAAQCFLFKQQQWLNILPLILLLSGSWVIYLGYQKENKFVTTLLNNNRLVNDNVTDNHQGEPQSIVNHRINKPSLQQTLENTVDDCLALTLDDLQKTMVIQNNEPSVNTLNEHHLTCKAFGRYQVEGILGKGAMGTVYQGVDPKINRHVAIKTLRLSDDAESIDNQVAKERFFKEAQTAGGLSHANIVTIYDVGEENNLGYIAMDLLTGAPLSLFTQPDKTLPAPLIYQLLIQICEALDYAHQQNVVHRDIKPANIIYDDDLLRVTVTDFGIAYVSDNSKTKTGIIMGSPYYMSPEQILGLKIDGRSDIFSLGVTFYQLLCGHLPFTGESIATVAYQITKVKAIAVNQHNSKLPSSAQRICNKAMHKDSAKRYQSMAEFRLALIGALKRDFKVSINE